MKKMESRKENYSSKLIDKLVDSIKPEEQAKIDCKMMLAAKIQAALKAKGWKSLDLANALNVNSPSIISKWLSGTQNFTVETLVDIQRVLDIKLIDVELEPPMTEMNVKYVVSGKPASIKDVINEPLEKVLA